MTTLRNIIISLLSLTIVFFSFPVWASSIEKISAKEKIKIQLLDSQMDSLLGGSSDLDAKMLDYISYDPNEVLIAKALITNRSKLNLEYSLDVIDFNTGAVLENLAHGVLHHGTSKIIKGKPTVKDKRMVRVIIGDPVTGFEASDTTYIQNIR